MKIFYNLFFRNNDQELRKFAIVQAGDNVYAAQAILDFILNGASVRNVSF